MSTEQMRAEFAAWADGFGLDPDSLAGLDAWIGWKACASLHQERITKLRAALAEMVDSHTAKYPYAEEGALAQSEWCYRQAAAIAAARAALKESE